MTRTINRYHRKPGWNDARVDMVIAPTYQVARMICSQEGIHLRKAKAVTSVEHGLLRERIGLSILIIKSGGYVPDRHWTLLEQEMHARQCRSVDLSS